MTTRVNINGPDHQVEISHDGQTDLTYVVEKAQKLWDDTKPPERAARGTFGFTAERESRCDGFAWGLGKGEQPVVKP